MRSVHDYWMLNGCQPLVWHGRLQQHFVVIFQLCDLKTLEVNLQLFYHSWTRINGTMTCPLKFMLFYPFEPFQQTWVIRDPLAQPTKVKQRSIMLRTSTSNEFTGGIQMKLLIIRVNVKSTDGVFISVFTYHVSTKINEAFINSRSPCTWTSHNCKIFAFAFIKTNDDISASGFGWTSVDSRFRSGESYQLVHALSGWNSFRIVTHVNVEIWQPAGCRWKNFV